MPYRVRIISTHCIQAFEDGVYIELISFTHPFSYYPPNSPEYEARKKHYWANKEPGFIDFAFLGNAGSPSISAAINARAEKDGSGVQYAGEFPGGRTRTDGKVLQWLISGPMPDKEYGDVRGKIPFFCGDLTPRDFRVSSLFGFRLYVPSALLTLTICFPTIHVNVRNMRCGFAASGSARPQRNFASKHLARNCSHPCHRTTGTDFAGRKANHHRNRVRTIVK